MFEKKKSLFAKKSSSKKQFPYKRRIPRSMKKLSCFFIMVVVFCNIKVWAGDIASYVDLGFSQDGKIYMFAQYGVQSRTLLPWADLFVIDVPQNNFVTGGKVSFTHDSPVLAGQDGSSALYRIIARNAALADRYGVTYLLQGQALYIALNGDGTAGGEIIEFRDFELKVSYRAALTLQIEGTGANLKSSFYIQLERTALDGSKKVYTVGTPQLKRPLISSYRIKKVMVAPKDGSIIFVIEMKKQGTDGMDIRYMVEALRL
jgi:predicted secreted protein